MWKPCWKNILILHTLENCSKYSGVSSLSLKLCDRIICTRYYGKYSKDGEKRSYPNISAYAKLFFSDMPQSCNILCLLIDSSEVVCVCVWIHESIWQPCFWKLHGLQVLHTTFDADLKIKSIPFLFSAQLVKWYCLV